MQCTYVCGTTGMSESGYLDKVHFVWTGTSQRPNNDLQHTDLNYLQHTDLNHLQQMDLNHLQHMDPNHLQHTDLNHLDHMDLNHLEHTDLNHLHQMDLNHLQHKDPNHSQHTDLNHLEHMDLNHLEQCCPTFLAPRAAQDIIMNPRAAPVNSKVTTIICWTLIYCICVIVIFWNQTLLITYAHANFYKVYPCSPTIPVTYPATEIT